MGLLTVTTSSDQSKPGGNGNNWVHHILQSSRTGASPSDDLRLYPEQFLEVSHLSAGMQSMYTLQL